MVRVSVIPGDGIGPKVVGLAVKILENAADSYGFHLEFVETPAGDSALKKYGEPLPKFSLEKIEGSDACLKGPVGETAKDVIVFLRQHLDLYANIRPFKTYRGVRSIWSDIDLVIVRENTEDLYRAVEDVGPDHAVALMVVTKRGTERIARTAFELASKRRQRVSIIHKANILRSYRFFRDICFEIAKEYGEVEVDEFYVDNAAYQLIVNPKRFDVILTPNMFGDILSDEAAGLVGSLGLTCSANIGENFGLFEPVHGSAPDIDPEYSNPLGQILTASMMLDWISHKLGDKRMGEAAQKVQEAVEKILEKGSPLTPDLGGNAKADNVANEIIKHLKHS